MRTIGQDQKAALKQAEAERHKEDAEEFCRSRKDRVHYFLKSSLERIAYPEGTVLYYHALPVRNLLVGERGDMMGIAGWECVPALPLWMTTKFIRVSR
jgi:hypothetical protein